MAMGIVSDADFNKEKSSLNIPSAKTEPKITGEVVDVSRGRGTGNTQVPDGIKKIIGEESAINGRQAGVELAESFGVSPSSVSAYSVGANSTSSYDDRPHSEFLKNAKSRLVKKARNKMMLAINGITKDKIDITNAKELAGIAKDMAAVVRTLEPEPKVVNPTTTNTGPQFIFYSPQTRKEDVFDVVHVKE